MKINIAVKLDYQKLENAIENYIKMYKQDPVILVNYSVCKDMEINASDLCGAYDHPDGVVHRYNGYRVFVDPTLDHGEVELR